MLEDSDRRAEAERERRRRREGAGEAGAPRRRKLLAFLADRESGFEELRRALGIEASVLEDDLRHAARTAKAAGARLVVEPAACRACGFVFRGRTQRRFAAPGRCPRCRSERIEDVRLRLERRAGSRAQDPHEEPGDS